MSNEFIKHKRTFVSAIVPFYNEEKTIATVVRTLLQSKFIDEIICVNDGSFDNSAAMLAPFKKTIKIVTLSRNHGKGNALAEGIKKSRGDIVAFFDADLLGLREEHIQTILSPLLEKKYKAVLGYKLSKKYYFFDKLFLNICGERAYFKKDILPYVEKMRGKNFGAVELYLNSLYRKHEISKVPLLNLSHKLKHQKHTKKQAIEEFVKESAEIAKELGKTNIKRHVAPIIPILPRKKSLISLSLYGTLSSLVIVLITIIIVGTNAHAHAYHSAETILTVTKNSVKHINLNLFKNSSLEKSR